MHKIRDNRYTPFIPSFRMTYHLFLLIGYHDWTIRFEVSQYLFCVNASWLGRYTRRSVKYAWLSCKDEKQVENHSSGRRYNCLVSYCIQSFGIRQRSFLPRQTAREHSFTVGLDQIISGGLSKIDEEIGWGRGKVRWLNILVFFLFFIVFSKLRKYKITITVHCHIVAHHWEIETLVVIFHFQELVEADDEQTNEAPETK